MLALKITNPNLPLARIQAHLVWTLVLFALTSMTGCCQVVFRGPLAHECGSPLLDCVDQNECEPAERVAFDRLQQLRANLQMRRAMLSDSLHSNLDRCSTKINHSWNDSKIAQWKAEQREKLSAPPYPKFHPIPTHDAFYPEPELPE